MEVLDDSVNPARQSVCRGYFFDSLVPISPQNATPKKGGNKKPSSENKQRKAIFSPKLARAGASPGH